MAIFNSYVKLPEGNIFQRGRYTTNQWALPIREALPLSPTRVKKVRNGLPSGEERFAVGCCAQAFEFQHA